MELLGGHFKRRTLAHRLERLRAVLLITPGEILHPEPPRAVARRARQLTAKEQAALAARYEAGALVSLLAHNHGIHPDTVSAILERQGVARRYRLLDEQATRLATELYESGLSLADVGERLDVAAHTVRTALRATGVRMRPVGTNQWR